MKEIPVPARCGSVSWSVLKTKCASIPTDNDRAIRHIVTNGPMSVRHGHSGFVALAEAMAP
jgi:hypothetical protein